MDVNYFFGNDFKAFATEPLRSSVSLQWALDLMCEKLMGVSNFLFLVVVSLKDSAFKTRFPYVLNLCFFLTCAGILPMLLLSECTTEEFRTYEL